jgi:hypothetical protein
MSDEVIFNAEKQSPLSFYFGFLCVLGGSALKLLCIAKGPR